MLSQTQEVEQISALNPHQKMNLAIIEVLTHLISYERGKQLELKDSLFLIEFFKSFQFYNVPIVLRTESYYTVIHNQVDVEIAKGGGVKSMQALLWQPTKEEQEKFYYYNLHLRFKSLSYEEKFKEIQLLRGKLNKEKGGILSKVQWGWPSSDNNSIDGKLKFILGQSEEQLRKIRVVGERGIHHLRKVDKGEVGFRSWYEQLFPPKKVEVRTITDGEVKKFPVEVKTISDSDKRGIDIPDIDDDFDIDNDNISEEVSEDTVVIQPQNLEGKTFYDARQMPNSILLQMLLDNATVDANGNIVLDFKFSTDEYENVELHFIATPKPSREDSHY